MKNELKRLSAQNFETVASGKTILIGEHSVVYGHKALAMALPDIQLKLTLYSGLDSPENKPSSWLTAWTTIENEKEKLLEEKVSSQLMSAFEKSLALVSFPFQRELFIPQKFVIQSQIPLGGGMGGSAAISTCLVRLAQWLSKVTLTPSLEVEFANEVDSLFHGGKASGLDVSAIVANGIIEFQKGTPLKRIHNKCHFWLALLDSGERGETSKMIQIVKEKLNQNPKNIEDLFLQLHNLEGSCREYLETNQIKLFSDSLNKAQFILAQLGVSTAKIDQYVIELKELGALGAKLTGAGGGGLVLGVFNQKPDFLFQKYPSHPIFLTEVKPS